MIDVLDQIVARFFVGVEPKNKVIARLVDSKLALSGKVTIKTAGEGLDCDSSILS